MALTRRAQGRRESAARVARPRRAVATWGGTGGHKRWHEPRIATRQRIGENRASGEVRRSFGCVGSRGSVCWCYPPHP